MVVLAIAQFIILLTAFLVIKHTGKQVFRITFLDFFIGSLVPLGFLGLLVYINDSFFAACKKYNSPGTLFWNFVAILPMGITFYFLRKSYPLKYKGWSVRIIGVLLFLILQTALYIVIPDLGY